MRKWVIFLVFFWATLIISVSPTICGFLSFKSFSINQAQKRLLNILINFSDVLWCTGLTIARLLSWCGWEFTEGSRQESIQAERRADADIWCWEESGQLGHLSVGLLGLPEDECSWWHWKCWQEPDVRFSLGRISNEMRLSLDSLLSRILGKD